MEAVRRGCRDVEVVGPISKGGGALVMLLSMGVPCFTLAWQVCVCVVRVSLPTENQMQCRGGVRIFRVLGFQGAQLSQVFDVAGVRCC